MADDEANLQDVLEHARECLGYLEGVRVTGFVKDRRLQLVVQRLVEIIAEAAGRVHATIQTRIEVDWRGLRGLRNVIAHQYGRVDAEALLLGVRANLPDLVAKVQAFLDDGAPLR